MALYAQGKFAVMTNEELLAAIVKDGVARFLVCGSELLGKLWTDGEDAVQDKSLVVKLDPSCPLFYMNSCQDKPADENVQRFSVFENQSPTKDTAKNLLVDAEKGVGFKIARNIQDGEQLLHLFPTRNTLVGASDSGDGRSGGGINDGVGSPNRRSRRLNQD